MACEPIEYANAPVELPPDVEAFLTDARRRCAEFFEANLNRRYPRFIPSDPAEVYAALHFVTESGLVEGERFVEWGCGFGIATGLAALLGYEATGIEIEDRLADVAEELLRVHDLNGEIVRGSYLPEGFETYEAVGGSALIVANGSERGPFQPIRHTGMTDDTDEIDLFFVYPWPAEQEMMLELFDTVAGEGAILIAYYAEGDICIYRKSWES